MPTITPIRPTVNSVNNRPLNNSIGRDGNIEQFQEHRYRLHILSTASKQLIEPAVFAVFDELTTLPFNWDAEGGLPISPEVINIAKVIIKNSFLQISSSFSDKWLDPDVSPTPDGGLDLEWEREQYYLMIHITGKGIVRFLFRFDNSKAGSGIINLEQAVTIVNLVFSR